MCKEFCVSGLICVNPFESAAFVFCVVDVKSAYTNVVFDVIVPYFGCQIDIYKRCVSCFVQIARYGKKNNLETTRCAFDILQNRVGVVFYMFYFL